MTPGRLPSGPPPSWLTLGLQGLKANVGKLRVSPASWHLTLPHGAPPFPSLSPTHTQAPSNLKCFADYISSSLQALDKGPGSHHGPGYLGEKKEGEKNHRVVLSVKIGAKRLYHRDEQWEVVCGVILGWL